MMKDISRRFYAVAGTVIAVSATNHTDLQNFDAILEGLQLAAPANPGFVIDIRETATLDEADIGSVAFEGQVAPDGLCRLSSNGEDTFLVFPGKQTLRVEPARKQATLSLSSGIRACSTSLMQALEAALDAAGLTLLHMAGLVSPEGKDVVLVHAPSGTGKTTTSLALASRGFKLCSDDAMIIDVNSSAPVAWSFPRFAKASRRTVEMVPALSSLAGDFKSDDEELVVPLTKLSNFVAVSDHRARSVAAIIYLSRAVDGVSKLYDSSKADAIVALAADNVRTGKTGLLSLQRKRFSAITKLASSVPTFNLDIGTDPLSGASLIQGKLREL